MTTYNVSFADVEGQDRTPIKAGKYDVVVNGIEMRQSDNSEHTYLNWELEITDGEHEGRKLWMITSLSPKALWNLQGVMQSFGYEDEEIEFEVDEDTNMLLSPDLTGEAGEATVVNKLYEGRPQAKVTNLVGGEAKPKKRSSSNGKATRTTAKETVKSKAKAKDDEDDDDAADDDDDEPEEKPAKRVNAFARKGAATAKAGAAKKRFR